MSSQSAFFAYPSNQPHNGWAISAALESRNKNRPKVIVTPWPQVPNVGLRLDDKLREQIDSSVCLIPDITISNFNVYYEIGFAIGRGKPILPTIDTTVEHAKRDVVQLGLLDTIGYAEYANSHDLEKRLENLTDKALLSEYAKNI